MRFFQTLSAVGMLLALLFFAASLTPSLMPRSWLVQGLLSGTTAAVGYLIGVAIGWLWRYLELPWLERQAVPIRIFMLIAALIIAATFLWKAVGWQNSIRILWQMQPADSADPFRLASTSAAVFLLLLGLGRLFHLAASRFSAFLDTYVPRRVSNVIGAALAVALFWLAGEGLVLRLALNAADSSFQKADALLDADIPAPRAPEMEGSPASLVSWEGLGRQGRHYVATGPKAEAISAFWGTSAQNPVRVYVGLNNAQTVKARAGLALAELQRQGGFERDVLVVIAPTGTGWIDPAAVDSLEYLQRGNVASVALQYSYLTSWLSLLVEPENGLDAARALFHAVYAYWKTLPEGARPRLYLHGLSLGALNSQMATDIYDVVGDPFDGALWSGPPFRSERWNSITALREGGSPAWLPRFRDGSVVRFSNQVKDPSAGYGPWGAIRIVYLQYSSDAVTFFEPSSFWREPEWLMGERGPDVSASFTWLPVISGLQLTFDMMIATSSPIGYGHVYAPEHYLDAWMALLDAEGMTAERVEALKSLLREQISGD